ncbi:MAG: hypothetical protein ACMXX9_04125 [Candidatus Woesearchaeota archaeon]
MESDKIYRLESKSRINSSDKKESSEIKPNIYRIGREESNYKPHPEGYHLFFENAKDIDNPINHKSIYKKEYVFAQQNPSESFKGYDVNLYHREKLCTRNAGLILNDKYEDNKLERDDTALKKNINKFRNLFEEILDFYKEEQIIHSIIFPESKNKELIYDEENIIADIKYKNKSKDRHSLHLVGDYKQAINFFDAYWQVDIYKRQPAHLRGQEPYFFTHIFDSDNIINTANLEKLFLRTELQFSKLSLFSISNPNEGFKMRFNKINDDLVNIIKNHTH